MQINFLKLNDEKTEFIIFSTKGTLRNFINLKVNIGDHEVSSKEHVRNVGVIFDSSINVYGKTYELHYRNCIYV